MMRVTIFAGS